MSDNNLLKDESAIQEEEIEILENKAQQIDNYVIEEQDFELDKSLLPQNLIAQPTARELRDEVSELLEPSMERRDSNEIRESKLTFEQHAQPINPNLIPESDKSLNDLSETPKVLQKSGSPWGGPTQKSVVQVENSLSENPKNSLLSPSVKGIGLDLKKQSDKKLDMEKKRGTGAMPVSKSNNESNIRHLTPKKLNLGLIPDIHSELRSAISPKVFCLIKTEN